MRGDCLFLAPAAPARKPHRRCALQSAVAGPRMKRGRRRAPPRGEVQTAGAVCVSKGDNQTNGPRF
jgi:hypothetical protein